MVPVERTKLTGGLTYKKRRGTIVDWNLCFSADGTSSGRNIKSGTPAFMAPVLLRNKGIARRTLGHDMESFFAVIIWIASLEYENEDAFLAKPLAVTLLDNKKPMDIAKSKLLWFRLEDEFQMDIIKHFNRLYQNDSRFITCISDLRQVLYTKERVNKEVGDVDPEEELFWTCMKKIDDYLEEEDGCNEMKWIDSHSS